MEQLSIDQIMEVIPQRNPNLFVDRVDSIQPGESLDAVKNVTANENYFQGHFPEFPLMPGVLIVETLSQAASILILKSEKDAVGKETVLNSVKNVKFRHMVRPGDTLKIHVEFREPDEQNQFVMQAEGDVDGEKACSALLRFSFRK